MVIWRPESEEGEDLHGMWMPYVRVGEMGGNVLGFFGGVFSPDARYMLAHGYNGAFHLWHQEGLSILISRLRCLLTFGIWGNRRRRNGGMGTVCSFVRPLWASG